MNLPAIPLLIKGLELRFDKDFVNKAVAAIIAAAVTAALNAGLDTLVSTLASDPKYAAWAVVVTAIVAAVGKKQTALP